MLYNSDKYLITSYHVINEGIKNINIEIWNNKKIAKI